MKIYDDYKAWVCRNNVALNLLETGLSSLTWVLPDRFSESEFVLEALHTGINLLSQFHSSILDEARTPPRARGSAAGLATSLTALQQVQVLVELGALWRERQRGGDRYDELALFEALKAALRWAALRRGDTQILLRGGADALGGAGGGRSEAAHAGDVRAAFFSFHARCRGGDEAGDGGREADACEGREAGGRAGLAPPRLWWEEALERDRKAGAEPGEAASCSGRPHQSDAPSVGTVAALRGLLRRSSPPAAASLPELDLWAEQAQASAQALLRLGELVHVLRPVAYALALRRWGRASWRPWSLSLALELAALQCSALAARRSCEAARAAAGAPAAAGSGLAVLYGRQAVVWSPAEADELARRRVAVLFALLRDPVFGTFTRPVLNGAQSTLGRLPGLGWAGERLLQILDGAQQYYSYTAAS